jgi:hypothetical protein
MAKASKATAHYRPGTVTRYCAICTMFEPPKGCSSVEGHIRPQDLCDYFKRKHAMPWTGKEFAAKHNKKLSGPAAKKAASIASAIVRGGGDEGVAVATANKRVNNLRKRGVISDKQHEKMGKR